MLFLSKDDFYEVYLDSIISSNDRDNLAMLYQPIIGGDALSLYLSLYSDFKKTKKSNPGGTCRTVEYIGAGNFKMGAG